MTEIEKGSGNVFADLGFPDAETHQIKATLVFRISKLIKAHGLSQSEAAERMGMSQPDVSKMLNGQFRPVSLEKLIRCIVTLGQDVEISLSPRKRVAAGKATRPGKVKVRAA